MSDEKREQCEFSCGEPFCKTLDKAGVPADAKWRTLIIYMRGLEHFDFLTQKQKGDIQNLVIRTLQHKDYSQKAYEEILAEKEKIIMEPCQVKLQSALEETAQMVNEFKTMLGAHQGGVERLESKTVGTIESGGDPQKMVDEIRSSFQDVIQTMKRDSENLAQLSLTDALTGLNNRRALDSYLEKSILGWKDDKQPLAAMMLDIDNFKNFNDTHGHRIGDQALTAVAKIIKRIGEHLLEKEAMEYFPARYGGEEFSVIIPGHTINRVAEVGEDIRRQVERYNFVIRGADGEILKRGIHISISIGVAEMSPSWRGAYADNLIDAADKALYAAKKSGRNRVCLYSLSQKGEEGISCI